MSEARAFKVGDEVEVLPAPEGAEWDWQRVSGMRGRIEALRDLEPPPRILVALGEGRDRRWWWCDPAWFRLVPYPHEKAWRFERVHCASCGQEVPGTEAVYDDAPQTAPRYKEGDFVDMGDHKGLKVVDIDAEPRYTVEFMGGHRQRVKESTLKPHQPVPVVCTPDGTRCAWAKAFGYNADAMNWDYCPRCGGALRKEDA